MTLIASQKASFLTAKGIRIHFYKRVPAEAKGLILISHGYGEHYGLYEEFMGFLHTNGYGVFAYDHRGHGRCEEERGHIDRFEIFVEDMSEVVNSLKKEYPDLPLFIFGHSMGGLIAFTYGILYPEKVQGQVFSGAALGRPWGTNLIPVSLFSFLKRYFTRAKIHHLLTRRGSRNEALRIKQKNDPYKLPYSTSGFVYEFIYRGISWARSNAKHYRVPVLFLHGKSDKIVPYQVSEEMYESILSDEKVIKLYAGLYHELVNEPEREIVWQDILDWLELRKSMLQGAVGQKP